VEPCIPVGDCPSDSSHKSFATWLKNARKSVSEYWYTIAMTTLIETPVNTTKVGQLEGETKGDGSQIAVLE